MRVLVVSHSAVVGIYRQKFQALARLGCELHLLLPSRWLEGNQWVQAPAELEEAGVRLYVLPGKCLGKVGGFRLRGFKNLAKSINPDLIYMEEEPFSLVCWQALRFARQEKIPMVFFTWENILRAYKIPLNWVDAQVLARTQWAIAGNQEARLVLEARGFQGKCAVIPQYGVDPRLFKPVPELRGLRREFIIGYVGRLLEEKGIATLLTAARSLDFPFTLRIIGNGPYEEKLREKVMALGLEPQVEIMPAIPHAEIPLALNQLDALVLPSETRSAWKEQFGRVLVEAMACEIPVVGSSSGEIPQVIGEAGLVFPEGNAGKLAAQLRLIRNDPKLARILGLRGRQRVLDCFTTEAIALKIFSFWKEMLKKERSMKTAAGRGERRYVYQAPGMRLAAAILDFFGGICVWLFTLGQGLKVDSRVFAKPRRILVVRLDHIGDVLFARPAWEALRLKYPQARITALVSSAGAELLKNDPSVDQVIAWDAPWFNRSRSRTPQPGFFGLVKKLQRERFDLSLDLRGDLRHHVLMALARVRVRVGYTITGGGFLLHLPLRLAPGKHEVERNLKAVRALGKISAPEKYSPLALDQAEREFGKKVWQTRSRRVVVHPGAGDEAKCWPIAGFAAVCSELAKARCEIILVGTPGERQLAEQAASACSRPVRNLAGQTTLRELAALITRADLFVGNDSGPAHLALTQGIPAVILWSETNNPAEWGPWGKNVRACVVRQAQRVGTEAEVLKAARGFLERR